MHANSLSITDERQKLAEFVNRQIFASITKTLKTELKMVEPAAKKLKGAGSYDCTYKEKWTDSCAVGPVDRKQRSILLYSL